MKKHKPKTIGIGSRVLISNRTHPWYGNTGQITEEFNAPFSKGNMWRVELDNNANAGAITEDLQLL